MAKLFVTVLNMSLSGGIAIAVVLLLRLALRKAPRKYASILWVIVLVRLVCPFTFDLPVSPMPQAPDIVSQYESQYAQPATYNPPAVLPSVPDKSSTQNSNVQEYSKADHDASGVSGVSVAPAVPANPAPSPITIASFVWLAGVFILLGYSLVTVLRLKNKLKSAESVQQNIYEVQTLKTPFVLGVFHPKIYLPKTLSEAERRYILAHEQAHIRRADHIVKPLSYFVRCIHWFNPLVWLSFTLMSHDMELSVDEKVLAKFGDMVKAEYSQSLLGLSAEKRLLPGSPLAFGEGNVKNRVKNILSYKKPVLWVSIAAMLVVVVAGVAFFGKPKDNATDLPTSGPTGEPTDQTPTNDKRPVNAEPDTEPTATPVSNTVIEASLWTQPTLYFEASNFDAQQIAQFLEIFERLSYEPTSQQLEYPYIEIKIQDGDHENHWFIAKDGVIRNASLDSGNSLLTGDDNIFGELVDIMNDVLTQVELLERGAVSLVVDEQPLETSDHFYIKREYSHYFNVMELSELLGFEAVCTTDQPIQKNGATIPANTIAVFYEGHVTTLALGDSYAITTKIGESAPLYYPETLSPVFFEEAYYINIYSLPYLLFVELETPLPEDGGFMSEANLSTLSAIIEQTVAYAERKGYVYTPTGNAFYDRNILLNQVIARTKNNDADSLFWISDDVIMMGPIVSHLTHTDFGYLRSMDDANGDTYYGLYVQSFGQETLPLEYTEITCIDYRARFLSLATGFGESKRYGGAHIAPGLSTVTLIPITSKTPLTAEYMRDYILSQGVPIGGEWSDALYSSTIYTNDLLTPSSGDFPQDGATSIYYTHPIEWTSQFGSTDLDVVIQHAFQPDELKLRPGKTRVIQPAYFSQLEQDFYEIVYPDEQGQVLSEETYDLEGRRIYRYALAPGMVDGQRVYYPVHYFIYFDNGTLCDVTLYALTENDPHEYASLRRIIESMHLD